MKKPRCHKLSSDQPIIIEDSPDESSSEMDTWRADFLRLLDSTPWTPASQAAELSSQRDSDAQRLREAQEAERQRVQRREAQELAERKADKKREDWQELLSQLHSSDKEIELQAMAKLLEESESQDEVAAPPPPHPQLIRAPRGVCWHLMAEQRTAEESTSAMHEEISRIFHLLITLCKLPALRPQF